MRHIRAPFESETEHFLRALLHAARNAMQRSQNALSVLRLEARGHSEILALADEIEGGSDELGALFEAAQRHIRPVIVDLHPTDLLSVVREAWERVVPEGAGAELEIEPRACCWPVDAELLAEALRELLRNAVQARPEGLRVHVRSRERRDDSERSLELALTDNGPGLGEHEKDRVLEPFWSRHRDRLGMGLATAAKAIGAHHGRLSLENRPGGGARAVVWLPWLDPSEPP